MTEPAFQIITRAIWARGAVQRRALRDLERRGLWLSPWQRIAAGLDPIGAARLASDRAGAIYQTGGA